MSCAPRERSCAWRPIRRTCRPRSRSSRATGNRATQEIDDPHIAAALFAGSPDELLALSRRLAERDGPIVPVHIAPYPSGKPGRRGLAQRQHRRGRRQCQPDDFGVGGTGRVRAVRARLGLFHDAQQVAGRGRREARALGLAVVVGHRPGEDLRSRRQHQPRLLQVPAGRAVHVRRPVRPAGAKRRHQAKTRQNRPLGHQTPPKQLSFWQVTGPSGAQQSLLPRARPAG